MLPKSPTKQTRLPAQWLPGSPSSRPFLALSFAFLQAAQQSHGHQTSLWCLFKTCLDSHLRTSLGSSQQKFLLEEMIWHREGVLPNSPVAPLVTGAQPGCLQHPSTSPTIPVPFVGDCVWMADTVQFVEKGPEVLLDGRGV